MSWWMFREDPKRRARRLAMEAGRVAFTRTDTGEWRFKADEDTGLAEAEDGARPPVSVELEDEREALAHSEQIAAVRTWRHTFPSFTTGETRSLVVGALTVALGLGLKWMVRLHVLPPTLALALVPLALVGALAAWFFTRNEA